MAKKKNTVKMVFRMITLVVVTILLIGLTTAAMCGVAAAVYIDRYVNSDLDIDLDNFGLNFTSFVYYIDKETGERVLLEELHRTENRVWANLSEIPQNLKDAFIAIEDARFETHNGVDWKRTIGATLSWTGFLSDFTGGGSTITQQLIKNVTEEDDVTVKRKVQEIFRALELERDYTKDQILELYLNTIFLGQNCYGVRTAAQTYFGKDVSELTLAESASIAGITKYPYKFDPFRSLENNKERQEIILNEMCRQGKITEAERDAAKREELQFKKEEREEQKANVQSYFVDQIVNDVLRDLQEQKGYNAQLAATLLYTGGLEIYATIDPEIQGHMDAVFEDPENFPNVKGKDGSTPEAAMVIIDPYTGDVVAMRGGKGEKEGARILNRAVRSVRQPGSAIKPLAVYAPAFEYGIATPASAFDDVPVDFEISSAGWPKNYYSGYKGRMSVVQAVEISNNTIPAQLIQMITPERSYAFMSVNLGISSLERSLTTASGRVLSDISGPAALSLGGLTHGMSVLEMTAAYAAFVNDGKYARPRTYSKVVDSSGTVILDNTPVSTVAMSEKTAASVRNLLEVVVNGKVGGNTGSRAKITGIATGGKTGTTNDDKDRWFVGLTPYYVGSVWFGYDQPQELRNVGSTNPALALWKKVMDPVHEPLENRSFENPDDFQNVSFCRDSGCAATEWCQQDPRGSRVISMMMSKSDRPTAYCTLHQPVQIDSVTGMTATEYCPVENLKTVGLLDVHRLFPISVHVDDDPYTIPNYDAERAAIALYLAGGAVAGDSAALPTSGYNHLCSTHIEPQQIEDPDPIFPWDPGYDPGNAGQQPVNPGTDPSSGGDTSSGTGGQPPGGTQPDDPGGDMPEDPIFGGMIPY